MELTRKMIPGGSERLFKNESVEFASAEAIDFLKCNCTEHAVVCFSGGKDSIVTNALCSMAGISYSLVTSQTTIDPPQVTQFIRHNYPQCKFVRPSHNFWQLLLTHNPPGGNGRGIKWCCSKIKEKPMSKIPIKTRILGIRAEESRTRANYGMISEIRGEIHLHPIFHWAEWQVWEFIERYKLGYPITYDWGFARMGCVICPNHQHHHDLYRRHWPNHYRCFEKHVQLWFEKRKSQGKIMYHDSAENFLVDWYAGKFFYYKMNGHR